PGVHDRTHSHRGGYARPFLHHGTRGILYPGIMNDALTRLGLWKTNSGAGYGEWIEDPAGGEIASVNPADGTELARVRLAAEEDYDEVLWHATQCFEKWRLVPAPKRGEIVREIGDELRRVKDDLGTLVTLESGKILAE